MRELFRDGFTACVLVSDAASANSTYFKSMSCIKASELIDAELLEEVGLTGNFMIAARHCVTKVPLFIISDPPHCLKRITNAMENRDLTFGIKACNMDMLRVVYRSILDNQGDVTLARSTKLTIDHFHGNNWSKMNVKRSAQILSGTMTRFAREVCRDPATYKLPEHFVGTIDDSDARFVRFERIIQLCELVNRWFDLCNGKDMNINAPIRHMTLTNGRAYAKEFLQTLRWFQEWKDTMSTEEKEFSDNFVPKATYDSLCYICYGFAALITQVCLKGDKRNLFLGRMTQDVNEQHYGNVRAHTGSHQNPTQQEAMAAVGTSSLMRLARVKKGNTDGAPLSQRTNLPLKRNVPLKRKRANGSKADNIFYGKKNFRK
jgi:hypothetical protein